MLHIGEQRAKARKFLHEGRKRVQFTSLCVRVKLFVWGNALGLLLIATLLLSIPAAFAPIAFLLQWLKVSNLKRQLDANA